MKVSWAELHLSNKGFTNLFSPQGVKYCSPVSRPPLPSRETRWAPVNNITTHTDRQHRTTAHLFTYFWPAWVHRTSVDWADSLLSSILVWGSGWITVRERSVLWSLQNENEKDEVYMPLKSKITCDKPAQTCSKGLLHSSLTLYQGKKKQTGMTVWTEALM